MNMKMKKVVISSVLLFCLACQLVSSAPIPQVNPTPQPSMITNPVASATPQLPTVTVPLASATPTTPQPTENSPLAPLSLDFSQPFSKTIALTHWTSAALSGEDISLPINLAKAANFHILDKLTTTERASLSTNGFLVIHSQEAQFGDIRDEVAYRNGQPYYLTTDAAYHAMHLQFDALLKALEVQELSPMLLAITQSSLTEVQSYLPLVQGTAMENDTQEAEAYLSVALKLLQPDASIDPAVEEVVNQQVDQIMAYGGKDNSVLLKKYSSTFEDDYGAYRPVGHYIDSPELEQYFRAMTWYGRVNFALQEGSRLPAVVTLALCQAQVNSQPAADQWALIQESLNFMVGPSDDAGPLEYAALMDQVYGSNMSLHDLEDNGRWQAFLKLGTAQLPPPQINSTFVDFMVQLPAAKGWRFMGQRFTLDEFIFQNLIYDKVSQKTDGTRRNFPSALDVMAVLGSESAQQSLTDMGATQFPNYSTQLAGLQRAAQAQPEAQWLERFYSSWLYSFIPLLAAKGNAYPAYMRSPAWGYKDLNAALGSWTELKHDTILYTKMAEGAGGGGAPQSGPAPSYVEPNPEAFTRMAYMAGSLADGLTTRLQNYPPAQSTTTDSGLVNPGPYYPDLALGDYITGMHDLASQLTLLAQAASDELAGKKLSDDEASAILNCLGQIECENESNAYHRPGSEMPKVPVVAAVSGAGDSVLEAATGEVDRIYVVVPLENRWEIAQGGVYSYYEFIQPRDQRLTDDAWREKLTGSSRPALPSWASHFVSYGGIPSYENAMLFRVGDVYAITDAGDLLNVYAQPSTSSQLVGHLHANDIIRITDGPVVNGITFWKVQFLMRFPDPNQSNTTLTGWAAEVQDWYSRLGP
jgi:hypothetical protein